eukprot:TRINITY_DN22712_c0_g1_i1.p1 TRINITY_DN22712_c0_g1~~TRINITY_DN22712_c0_g1_i1.p1  ORF type:complete len:206 (-),score=11.31 TRINITY_DN22712_c0_g1_i1:14-631(-)
MEAFEVSRPRPIDLLCTAAYNADLSAINNLASQDLDINANGFFMLPHPLHHSPYTCKKLTIATGPQQRPVVELWSTNFVSGLGSPPLHYASASGSFEAVSALLTLGAAPDTPAHLRGYRALDPTKPDTQVSCWDIARLNQHEQILALDPRRPQSPRWGWWLFLLSMGLAVAVGIWRSRRELGDINKTKIFQFVHYTLQRDKEMDG